jgi:hypothetical protein
MTAVDPEACPACLEKTTYVTRGNSSQIHVYRVTGSDPLMYEVGLRCV